jgi:hypothetical protein
MIKGLTHDVESGVINRVIRFRGKISAGYAPNEPPNKNSYPMPCGFFRFLKKVLKPIVLNGVTTHVQEWTLDQEMQSLLTKANKGSTNPRRIEAVCMFPTPEEMWDSYMGKYSATAGLLCKSNGKDSVAMQIVQKGDSRVWEPRLFNGKPGCPYDQCPDFKAKACKCVGILHVYPTIHDALNPYQYTTRSVNSVLNIESALNTMYNIQRSVYQSVNGKIDEYFTGLAGLTYTLVHSKIKSGGRDVFVTQIEFSEQFSNFAMRLLRENAQKQQALIMSSKYTFPRLGDSNNNIDLIENTKPELAEISEESDSGLETITEGGTSEQEVAVEFNADADKIAEVKTLDAAAKDLLDSK